MAASYDSVWMRTREVADLLGLTPAAVADLVDDGILPGYRFGTVVRCRRRDVETFVDANGITSGRDATSA
jgi:excisionase family DNA binding protein